MVYFYDDDGDYDDDNDGDYQMTMVTTVVTRHR